MRVLVCGSRDWDDPMAVSIALMGLSSHLGDDPDLVIVEGGARGADSMAGECARTWGWPLEVYPAEWDKYGRAAGPIRNQQMLDVGKPDRVFAFHDNLAESRGTADMVRRAKAAGVPVYVVSRA